MTDRQKDGNPDWKNDQHMIDWNNQMVQDVQTIVKTDIPNLCFQCANAIVALFGGKAWDPKTGLRDGQAPPKDQKQEGDPPPDPWGTPEERDKPLWQDCLEFVPNMLAGVAQVIGETVEGILTLVPVLPLLGMIGPLRRWAKDTFGYDIPTWDSAGEAWKGLATLAVNLVTFPAQLAWWGYDKLTGQDTRPQFVKDLGEQGVGMLKGMVAWDEWSKNPGKAFGMALTNIAATAASFGAGGAIRDAAMAGKLGMASAAVAKVAKVADFASGIKAGIHDAALGAAMKIPKVGAVVEQAAKIPIVGHNFTMHRAPKVEVPTSATPDVSGTTSHAGADAPHARESTPTVDSPSIHTPHVDAPSVHSPGTAAPVHTPATDAPVHAPGGDGPGVQTPGSHAPSADSPQAPHVQGNDVPGNTPSTGNPVAPVSHVDPAAPPAHVEPGTTAPASHTDPGTTAPASHADPVTTPGAHTEPGTTNTPASHTDPTTTPGAHTEPTPGSTTPGSHTEPTSPGTHTEPGSTTPGSHTDPGTTPASHTPEPQTTTHQPTGTHTPESNTPGATHTPESNTPGTTHTPEPNTPGTHTPGTHTPEPTGARTPETSGTHTPETHTPESPGTNTPETHTPESTPGRPDELTPAAHADPAVNPPVTPVMPMHPGIPGHPGAHAPETPTGPRQSIPDRLAGKEPSIAQRLEGEPVPRVPRQSIPDRLAGKEPSIAERLEGVEPVGPHTPETPRSHVPGAPEAHEPQLPRENAPRTPDPEARRGPEDDQFALDRTHSPEHEFGPSGTNRETPQHSPQPRAQHDPSGHDPAHDGGNDPAHDGGNDPAHDGGNDPRYDDPLERQIELDRMKPDYLQPGPNKPRSLLDRYDHLTPHPMDPRGFELKDAVAGKPVENVQKWIHKVNPANGFTKQFGMNCPDVSRSICEILNGEEPRLAAGNKFARGEHPDTTLEWMGLKDVPEANKFHRPPGQEHDWSLDQQAYQKVRDALAGRPPGTHANIGVYYVGGGGHRFTAFVDKDGAMKWLDGQPSQAARRLAEGSPEQLAQIERDMLKHSNQIPVASHVDQLDFAVREPGGQWEGVPRTPDTPPASQSRFGARNQVRGSRGAHGGAEPPRVPSLDERLNPGGPRDPEPPRASAPQESLASRLDPERSVSSPAERVERVERVEPAESLASRLDPERSVSSPAERVERVEPAESLASRLEPEPRAARSEQPPVSPGTESIGSRLNTGPETSVPRPHEPEGARQHFRDRLDGVAEPRPTVEARASELRTHEPAAPAHEGNQPLSEGIRRSEWQRHDPAAESLPPRHSPDPAGRPAEPAHAEPTHRSEDRSSPQAEAPRQPEAQQPHDGAPREPRYRDPQQPQHAAEPQRPGASTPSGQHPAGHNPLHQPEHAQYGHSPQGERQYGQPQGQHRRPETPNHGEQPSITPAGTHPTSTHPAGAQTGSGQPADAGTVAARNEPFAARAPERNEFVTNESPKLEDAYRRIRETADDVPKVAEAAGLDPGLVDVAKHNVFVKTHDVAIGPGDIRHGNFTPIQQIADLWDAAASGRTLTRTESNELRSLIAHEVMEAKLIDSGVPYNFADPKLWDDGYYDFSREHAGAHQVAPRSMQSSDGVDLLQHWRRLGLTPPPGGLAADLSNLDEVIRIAREGMGW